VLISKEVLREGVLQGTGEEEKSEDILTLCNFYTRNEF
jgi:hypothetical protein